MNGLEVDVIRGVIWLGVLPALTLAASCAEWPRSAHLQADTGLVSTLEEPRLTIQASWTKVRETSPDANDSTVQTRSPYPLSGLSPYDATGYLIRGGLQGVDWDASAEPEPLVNESEEGCEDVEGAPLILDAKGDYAGDLDFFLFDVEEDAGLCASLAFDDLDQTLGVDVLLVHLDDCSLPASVELTPGSSTVPLGYLQATDGPIEWSTTVSAGEHLAVLVTGYARRDGDAGWEWGWDEGPELHAAYRLGVSMVPLVEGEPALCPLLPKEPS